MLTLISSVSDHFHFALAIPSKIIWPQEITQTFMLMTFCVQEGAGAITVWANTTWSPPRGAGWVNKYLFEKCIYEEYVCTSEEK